MESEGVEDLLERNRELQSRLEEAEEILRALRGGEVDAIVAAGPDGDRVYTLKGADEAYRTIVQDMAEGALTLTLDGLILFSNEQFASMARVPLERVIGSHIQNFIQPEEAPVLSALLSGRDSRKAEVRLKVEEAVTVPVFLSLNTVVLGGVECVCVIVTDLTGQKRNEEIVAAEKLARSILDQAAGAMLVVDPDGKIIRASRAARKLAGDTLLLRQFDSTFALRASSGSKEYAFAEILSMVQRNGDIAGLEATARTSGGRTLEVRVNAALLTNPDSEVLGCIVMLHDVSGLKRAEEALRESEAQFRTLANAIPHLCWMANADGWIFWYNQRWYEYTGTTPEQMEGWGWQSVHDPKVLPQVLEHWKASIATGNPFEMVFPLRAADGEFRPFLTRGVPVLNQDGRVVRWFGTNTDISEQRRTEEALRESEQRFRALATASSEVLYHMSPDWTEMRQLRGGSFLAGTEAPNRNWLREYIPPDDQPRVTAAIDEAIRTKSIFELEHRVMRGDGSRGWTFSRAIPVQNANGQIVEWFGVASDITQRKLAEQALRESEERFRSLADGCPAIIWVGDAEGGNRFVNRTYREFFGVTSAQVEGHKWQPLIHPDDAPEYMRAMLRAVREHARVSAEARVRRADGEWRWIAAHAEPRFSQSGEFIGHSGIGPDITERKRAEQALADAIQRLDAHMDNSPLAVIEFDPQFRLTRWSKEAEKIFGWSAEEVLGRAMGEVRWIYEEDADAVLRVAQQMLDGTHPRNLSINRNYRKDGSLVECEWYNSALYDRNGKLASILSQVLDVTDRRRAEERLRQAQKMESVGLLAGGIAHDFNNLLTAIMGNASIVLDEIGPGPAARIEEVIQSSERAASLTRQLLAYSGKGQFIVRDIDISQAVNEMADLVQFSIPKSVDLALNVRRRLPTVRMDPSQMQQILMNLVINAGEAIGEGNIGKITVATSMTDVDRPFVDAVGEEIEAGRYVCIEVSDTGSGIEEQMKPKIFDPFFTTKFTGRGLGLAAVAGIVRSQKGAITVQSGPSRGTIFRVFLPVADGRAQEPEREPGADGRATILVVDDEASVRDFIGSALRRQGYRVLLASDGRDALATCERENGRIDGAILDIVMPVMGANDLLLALRAQQPRMKILLTSGYSESEARRLCAAYPSAAFIQKPYTAQQINQAVEELLSVGRK